MSSRNSHESAQPMLPQHEPEYKPYPGDDDDLLSDTTRVSSLFLDPTKVLLRRRPSVNSSWTSVSKRNPPIGPIGEKVLAALAPWLRWCTVVMLQSVIIGLLVWPPTRETGLPVSRETEPVLQGKVVQTGGDINGLYKDEPHTYDYLKPDELRYVPNMTSMSNRMEIRRNWDLLMPLGSGSVAIPNYRDYPLLGDPIVDDPIRSGPLFEASWTHALHCLYYTVDSYHSLIVNGRTDDDNPHHAGHCFEYLRNSILCNLDMTLEGSASTMADKERGQPHVCRNRQAAVDWIEARRVDDLQDIVGP